MKKKKYEEQIDLRCAVDYQIQEMNVGAYLLERNGNYALRFGFKTSGIPSHLLKEAQEEALDDIAVGIRSVCSLEGQEMLRIVQKSFYGSDRRAEELEELAEVQTNGALEFLALADRANCEELGAENKRREYSTIIYGTYGNEFNFAENLVENALRKVNRLYRYIKGSYSDELNQQLEPFLLAGFEEFLEWKRILEKRFKLTVKALNTSELKLLAWQEFNLRPPTKEDFHTIKISEENGEIYFEEENDKLALRSVLIKGDAGKASIPESGENYIKIKEKYIGAVVIENRLEGYEDSQTENQLLFWWNCLKNIPDCEIVTEIFRSNTKLDKLRIARNIRGAKGSKQLVEKYGGEGVESDEEIIDARETLKQLAGKHRTFAFSVVIFPSRKTLTELDRTCQEIVKSLPLGLAIREDCDVHSLWRNKQGFNWRPLVGGMRRQTYSDLEIPVPLVAPQKFGKNRGIEFYDADSLSPMLINYIDDNHNTLFIAQKRTGKTATVIAKIVNNLLYKIPSTFLDYGMVDERTTCSDLVDFLGEEIAANIKMGTTPCNIFQLPNYKKFGEEVRLERMKSYQNSLFNFLEQVLNEDNKTVEIAKDKRKFLDFGMTEFFENSQIRNRYDRSFLTSIKEQPTAIDLIEFLENIESFTSANIEIETDVKERVVRELKLFFYNGFGKTLCHPGGVDFTTPFLNFSLRGAKNKSEITLCAMAVQALANARAMVAERSYVALDEGSLLLSDPALAKTSGEFAVNGAKSGIILDVISQDVSAIVNSAAAAQFSTNLDIKLIGSIASSDKVALANYLNVDPSVFDLNASRGFLPNPIEFTTHWRLFYKNQVRHLLLRVNPHFLAIVSSNPDEQKVRQRYLNAYDDPIEGLIELGKDYQRAKKNGTKISDLYPQKILAKTI